MSTLPMPPPKIICRVQALYAFHSEESTCLSFEQGDQIEVLSKLESGWWNGWCKGQRGWFPSNYVQVISEEMTMFPRPPEKSLPPHPAHHMQQGNRFSMHSSSSSEVSRNNANLPDGWTIKMTEDGRSWLYYNEYTGQSTTQNPHLFNGDDAAIDTSRRSSVYSNDESREFKNLQEPPEESEQEPAALTVKELMDNWVERKTPQGRPYFCNLVTQETTWDYDEIDTETGHLKKTQEEKQASDDDIESDVDSDLNQSKHSSIHKEDSSAGEAFTWNKLATDIAFAIRQLTLSTQKGVYADLQPKTAIIVEAVRLMLYASNSLEKDSPIMQSPSFREPRRAVMSSLSKLVLSAKMGAEISEFSSSVVFMFQKVQRDANDVLVAVRNFVTICQQHNVTVNPVNPRLLDDISQLPFEPSLSSPHPLKITSATLSNSASTSSDGKVKSVDPPTPTSLLQKTKYLLNQDLVSNLKAYSLQIYGTTEELTQTACSILQKHEEAQGGKHSDDQERSLAVFMFRTLSNQITQYIGILDNIQLDDADGNTMPSIHSYLSSRQNLYTAIGHLFGAIQTLTNTQVNVEKAVDTINQSVVNVETAIESIQQDVIEMVNERKVAMGMSRDDSVASTLSVMSPTSSAFSERTAVDSIADLGLSAISTRLTTDESSSEFNASIRRMTVADITSRRRQQSIRSDDRTTDIAMNESLSTDLNSSDIEFGVDSTVKGGTLPALVERLTVHDTLDTNFIATFLLTYRSFCTTEEFISLLEDRYNLLPPERLTPEQLELWTERKQKLIRLRVFNVLKNWLENSYIDEDEYLLSRIEHFTNTSIRDSSAFAANQLQKLIRRRLESAHGEMKKIVQNPISGPDPIYPKNVMNIQLFDTDPLEMSRQLSIMDFKLYSSIRPIECLGKAWSRDGADGSIAMNIKQSIQYCNRLTAWVTESILLHEESKKRSVVVKYWVQVADYCRSINNYNTCMAVLSAFDNSAVGRLKKTWMMTNKSTIQTLAQIRKLLGANRNFTEYREIVHSVNPPCIPFLGIYLQDLTFIEDGNPDYLHKSSNLINFAKRQKTAEVIRELKQFQNFAYNFHTIPEFQDYIKGQLDQDRDVDRLYERSLKLEPKQVDNASSTQTYSSYTF
ncbi:ras guanine nucleotide exchange factor domain-containing protein [Mucor lusitanicus]|nr:ras guanine nucleotide exchange factor domain-containing protein [Mucor lusitanicus]